MLNVKSAGKAKCTIKKLLPMAGLAICSLLGSLSANAAPEVPRTTFVHLFEWTWPDIAEECEEFLGPRGFSAVQVSPPNEHIQGQEWWTRYQPVSYEIHSRGGTRDEFIDMVERCKAVGVDIYVDAIINHMGNGSGFGVAGSPYVGGDEYEMYSWADFNSPRCGINDEDYGESASRVRNCDLSGLPDLATGSEWVRSQIVNYMNDLLSIGVAGFRLDASKHMWPGDIQAIVSRLNGNPYIFQEVIDLGDEAVSASEYTHIANVTEFLYSKKLGETFKYGNIAWMSEWGEAWGLMPSSNAVVFTDNHDNQRGHGAGGEAVLTHMDAPQYDLANVLMMAWPYGYPKVMSSYTFDPTTKEGTDAGGPGTVIHDGSNLNCFGEWRCEHRWRGIANAVAFRNHTVNNWNVTDWWSNNENQIAFGRGDLGFVVINKEGNALTRTFNTSMAADDYCNTFLSDFNETTGACTGTNFEVITVNGDGTFTATIAPYSALMIHVGAKDGEPTPGGHGNTGSTGQGAPNANAGPDITVFAGTQVQFNGSGSSDSNGTIVSYSWSNGESGAQPTRTYNTPGTYTVTLTVTDDEGNTDTDDVVITVADEQPVISPTSICYDNYIGASNPKIHMWNSNPSGAISSTQWPGYSMYQNGDFVCYDPGASVTSINVIFSDNGNSSTQTNTLVINGMNTCRDNFQWKTLEQCGFALDTGNMKPVANAGSNLSIMTGETANFDGSASVDNDGSIVDWIWSNGLMGETASLVYENAGTFVVTLTVVDNEGSMDTDTLTVTVTEAPEMVRDSAICFDNPSNWANPKVHMWNPDPVGAIPWTTWPGLSMTNTGDYVCYDPNTEYETVDLIFSNNGASQTNNLTATAGSTCYKNGSWTSLGGCGFVIDSNQAPVSNAGVDQTVVEGSTVVFNGSGSTDADGFITEYSWSNGLEGSMPHLAYPTAGTFSVTLTVTDDDGVSSTDEVTITVTAPPVEASATSICFDNPNNWANPKMHMWASNPSGVITSTNWPGVALTTKGQHVCYDPGVAVNSLNVVFSNNGGTKTGDLNINGTNTCYDGGTWKTLAACGFVVDDNIAPVANAGTDITVNVGETITLDASGSFDSDGAIATYRWSNGLIGIAPSHTFETAGVYDLILTVTDDEGLIDSDTVKITVIGGSTTIYAKGLGYAPYMHYWNVLPEIADSQWPGNAMTLADGGVYRFDVPTDVMSMGLVFSNDGMDKTGDLTYNGGAKNCYDNGTWKTLAECKENTNNQTDLVPRTTFVHLFEWTWNDIAEECEDFLGPRGFSAVQVSPPNEHKLGSEWWVRYQPVSYIIESRGGTRTEFIDMVNRCAAVDVDIYVDAVINHMAADTGFGWDGSPFTYGSSYPDYVTADFNDPCGISDDDYRNNASRVRNCGLSGLPDLNTGSTSVRSKIVDYLNELTSIGVAGFRFDASKHMWPADIDAIVSQLNGNPYIFQEVIDLGGEAVSASEYTQIANVTEFNYSKKLGETFKYGNISWLENFGQDWGLMASYDAVVFTDNHDNQRGHGAGGEAVLTHMDAPLYDLANVYMLTYPYGYPKVMSSYTFDPTTEAGTNAGGPGTAIHVAGQDANCFGEWRCEHRWRGIANAVAFRNHTAGNWSITNVWSNNGNQLAYGRGELGYVVINAEDYDLNQTFFTGMLPGNYCNTFTSDFNETTGACTDGMGGNGETITVNNDGTFTANVPSYSALMIHVGAVTGTPTKNGHGNENNNTNPGVPTADAGLNISVETDELFQLDASGSTDSDGVVVGFSWSNGLSGVSPTYSYATAGVYTITLTVTDNDGNQDTDNVTVTVKDPIVHNYPTSQAIYYYNSNGWVTPTAHLWGSVPAGSTANTVWPGDAMTAFGEFDLYWIEIDDTTTAGAVLFSNDGLDKTGDLGYSAATPCYKGNTWMTLAQCGVPERTLAEAGPDRTVNTGSTIALSAAASLSETAGTVWTSGAWTGDLTGAHVVTPVLNTAGTYTVTMTLPNGKSDDFELTVVAPTQGLAERPMLTEPLGFPLTGAVDSGNYQFVSAFPNLEGFFVSPVMVTNDGVNQNLVYVVDKPGQVYVFPNDPAVTESEVVALLDEDFHKQVRNGHEQGMLSVAFHPNFATNRLMYVYYIEYTGNAAANEDYYATDPIFSGDSLTDSDFDDSILARFRLDSATNPTTAEANSFREVLRLPATNPDHKGGSMAFHPATGEFFMSIGELGYGDSATNNPTTGLGRVNPYAQVNSDLRGTVIRVDMIEGDTPDSGTGTYYTIPTDNPFYGNTNGDREEIWSWGHRNPWRMAFDTVADTSEAPENQYLLWEAEIGQDGDTRYEEVNIIRKGANYGWPICEGTRHRGGLGGDPTNSRSCVGDLAEPEGGFGNENGQSIIGGFVYRGDKLPALYGKYIFGDYFLKGLFTKEKGQTMDVLSRSFPHHISSFGTDVSGDEVFISTHGQEHGGPSSIYRIELDEETKAAQIREKLSETGVFVDMANRIPANGVIEYDINSHGWFDGAVTRHFIAIPNDQVIEVDGDVWELPVGTVLVKHVEIPVSASTTEPFETSVLFRQAEGNWEAVNYAWNAAGTEADLVTETQVGVLVDQWIDGAIQSVSRTVRAGDGCATCHKGGGEGKTPRDVQTRQLNGDFDYNGFVDNQVDVFAAIGLIEGVPTTDAFVDPEDTSVDLNERAVTYLDTNCSGCHFGGSDGHAMDLRIDTPTLNKNIFEGDRVIPFNHASSRLYIQQATDTLRMPQGSNITNPVAATLMQDWITASAAAAAGPNNFQISTSFEGDAAPGADVTFLAQAVYGNGFLQVPTSGVSWTTTDANVMPVSGTSGRMKVTSGSQGSATIAATFGASSDSVTVAVSAGPDKPTNLVANAVSSSGIKLVWADSATDEDNYKVFRADNSAGPFTEIATLAADSTSYLDTGLLPLTRYYYELTAVSTEGSSSAATANQITKDVSTVDAVSIVSGVDVALFAGETRQVVAVAEIEGEKTAATLMAAWSSDDETVATVSNSGVITAGATAGTATISADVEGTVATITVTNNGAGKYVFFQKPDTWNDVRAYAWYEEGTNTVVSGGWPGDALDAAFEYGGTWLRIEVPASWANTAGETKFIFNCGSNACETDTITVTQTNLRTWLTEDSELASAPVGELAGGGTQIQALRGSVIFSGSENLSGLVFPAGATLDLIADEAVSGQEFSFWQGAGTELMVDPSSPNTVMVIDGALSYSVAAVMDTITDDHIAGRDLYNGSLGCASCHAYDGSSEVSTDNGYVDLVNISDRYTLAELTTIIETTMPQGDAASCTGSCASDIASMIFENAFLPPENLCSADDLQPQDRGYRLLTTTEYNNSVRDLFGLTSDVDVTESVPADIPANGFYTNANMLFTNNYAAGYITAAQEAADLITNIYTLTPSCTSGDVSCFINDFGKRAYRRPVNATEHASLMNLQSLSGDSAMLAGILSSPAMLLRSEVGEFITTGSNSGYYQLTDYEVATFLAYTYWATTPDQMLMDAADAGELSTEEDIASMLSIMLADPKAEDTFERFVTGWLGLGHANPVPDADLSAALKHDMIEETVRLVRDVVFSGGTYNDLMTANYSWMTQDLANHYGLTWPGGTGWQKVYYPTTGANSERRGMLGHGSILSVHSAGQKTHPVRRGLFVRQNLLCQEFGAPPLGAELDPVIRDDQTVRQRFEENHAAGPNATPEEIEAKAACGFCHQHIDGVGFAFENYTSLGKWTTTEVLGNGNTVNVDSSGYIGNLDSIETVLIAGEPTQPFQGIDELAQLIADSTNGKACYARQWYRYTRGQKEESADSCTLESYAQDFKADPNASLLQLMIDYTQTSNFSLRK